MRRASQLCDACRAKGKGPMETIACGVVLLVVAVIVAAGRDAEAA